MIYDIVSRILAVLGKPPSDDESGHVLLINSLREVSLVFVFTGIITNFVYIPIWSAMQNNYLVWSNALFGMGLILCSLGLFFSKHTLFPSLASSVLMVFNIYAVCLFTSQVSYVYWTMLLLPVASFLIYRAKYAVLISLLTLSLAATLPSMAPHFEQDLVWTSSMNWWHSMGILTLVFSILSVFFFYLSNGARYSFAQLTKKNNELEQAHTHILRTDKERKKFIADMNHELRTPLNAVVGVSHLLGTHPLNPQDPEYRQLLSQMQASAKQILNIINEVLDLTKITEGKAALHLQNHHCQDIVQEAVSVVTPLLNAKQLTLHTDCVDAHIVCDGKKIKQILINLLSNAIKFTDRGGIYIQVQQLEGQSLKHQPSQAPLPPSDSDSACAIRVAGFQPTCRAVFSMSFTKALPIPKSDSAALA